MSVSTETDAELLKRLRENSDPHFDYEFLHLIESLLARMKVMEVALVEAHRPLSDMVAFRSDYDEVSNGYARTAKLLSQALAAADLTKEIKP